MSLAQDGQTYERRSRLATLPDFAKPEEAAIHSALFLVRSAHGPRIPGRAGRGGPAHAKGNEVPLPVTSWARIRGPLSGIDMIDMGILDPTKVTRSALQNASSVSGLMLTTEAMVGDLPADESASAPAPDMGGMGGMGGMGRM